VPANGSTRCIADIARKILTGSRGSGREIHLSNFIAVKLPLEFRFPEAALGQ